MHPNLTTVAAHLAQKASTAGHPSRIDYVITYILGGLIILGVLWLTNRRRPLPAASGVFAENDARSQAFAGQPEDYPIGVARQDQANYPR